MQRTLFLFTTFPPFLGLFFFRAEMFGLLMEKIPLVCWSQSSGYSLRVSKGSLYRVSPEKIPPKCWGWSNLWLIWMLSLIKKKISSSCIRGAALFKNIYKYHIFSVDDVPNSYGALIIK